MTNNEYSTEELKEIISNNKNLDWYHTFEVIPNTGVFTPGRSYVGNYDGRMKYLDRYIDREYYKGKRILDIGAYSGAWSYQLEEMGAEVVALDVYDPEKCGFSLIQKLRNSSVVHKRMSVYDISPENCGYFDMVCFFGVFYHLKHPMLALERIKSVCKPNSKLIGGGTSCDFWIHDEDESCCNGVSPVKIRKEFILDNASMNGIESLNDLPLMCYADGHYMRDKSNWFIPNVKTLNNMLKDSGFNPIDMKLISAPMQRDWNEDKFVIRSSIIFVSEASGKIRPEYKSPNMQPYEIPVAKIKN